MKTKDVFELLEEVYRRRRKVAEAKLRSAEDSLRSKEEHLAQLKEAAVSKEAANESEISNMIKATRSSKSLISPRLYKVVKTLKGVKRVATRPQTRA